MRRRVICNFPFWSKRSHVKNWGIESVVAENIGTTKKKQSTVVPQFINGFVCKLAPKRNNWQNFILCANSALSDKHKYCLLSHKNTNVVIFSKITEQIKFMNWSTIVLCTGTRRSMPWWHLKNQQDHIYQRFNCVKHFILKEWPWDSCLRMISQRFSSPGLISLSIQSEITETMFWEGLDTALADNSLWHHPCNASFTGM